MSLGKGIIGSTLFWNRTIQAIKKGLKNIIDGFPKGP